MSQLATPRTALTLALVAAAACSPSGVDPAGDAAPVALATADAGVQTRIVELGPLRISGVYHSMEGAFQRALLDTRGIGWITGFRTDVVDAATGAPMGDEFFCHSQIQLATGARLMVAATGIPELRLPEGFGIPLQQIIGDLEAPWRPVSLLGMVLNNHREGLEADVKLRFLLDYVPTDHPGAAEQITKLYRASVTVLPHRKVEVFEGDPERPAEAPLTAHGKTGHWMVPPGRQIIRQRHTRLIPGATQVHYGVVHLHNYGRSVKLTDVTEGKVLWQTTVEYDPDPGRVQIVRIPVYSDPDGFTIYPDHEYEIESVYENSSDAPVDAMAVMYLYHHPLGNQNMTYPPPPGAVPPGQPVAAGTPDAGAGHDGAHH